MLTLFGLDVSTWPSISRTPPNLEFLSSLPSTSFRAFPACIVANSNRSDTDAELEAIRLAALEAGAAAAVPSFHWAEGGKGAIELAKAVVSTCNADTQSFRFLYDLKTSIEEKIEIVSKEIYGADGTELSEDAQMKVRLYESQVDPSCTFSDLARDSGSSRFALRKLNIPSQQIPTPKEHQQASKSLSGTCEFLVELDSLSS